MLSQPVTLSSLLVSREAHDMPSLSRAVRKDPRVQYNAPWNRVHKVSEPTIEAVSEVDHSPTHEDS